MAAGDLYTASGTKISISGPVAATPATAAAYAALAWTEIGLTESGGEFGDESGVVTGTVLNEGRVRKAKGPRDGGNMTVTVFHDPSDAGQQAVVAAEKSTNGRYAIRITLPNRLNATGTDEINYFTALVTSRRLNPGAADNLVRRAFNFAIDSVPVEVAPTAGV